MFKKTRPLDPSSQARFQALLEKCDPLAAKQKLIEQGRTKDTARKRLDRFAERPKSLTYAAQKDAAAILGLSIEQFESEVFGPAKQNQGSAVFSPASNEAERSSTRDSVEDEIRNFLRAQRLSRDFQGQAIELVSSPELKGWTREQVTTSYAGPYRTPDLFDKMMQKFEPKPPIRETFGLQECSGLPIADADTPMLFRLVGGNYHHLFALDRVFLNRGSDRDCQAFRRAFEDSWIHYRETNPLQGTPLYHPVIAEVIVITSDNKLVLGRRNRSLIYGNLWSTSLEEQMLRGDPHYPKRKDKHVFDAAERGVREELGATVCPEKTRLLSVAITWGNFSGAFFFIVFCKETFELLVDAWVRARHDPYEAIALDCIDANVTAIEAALAMNEHSPSEHCRTRIAENDLKAGWHPTAKARLKLLSGHLKYLEETR
jgi:hypothetical protein